MMAGCQQSVAWSRTFSYETLERAHKAKLPVQVTVESWVDDLLQRSHGYKEEEVTITTCAVASQIGSDLLAQGQKISKKTCILASTHKAGKIIQNHLVATLGIKFPIVDSVRDLGIDVSFQKRRRNATAAGRLVKAMARMARTRWLTTKNRKATKIIKPGSVAQATWGFQALGMAPSPLLRFRRGLGRAYPQKKPQGCLVTGLALGMGPDKDPAVDMPAKLLGGWVEVLLASRSWLPAIVKVWNKQKLRTSKSSRWSATHGPVGAVQCTLTDIGWDGLHPLDWKDDTGQRWQLDLDTPGAKKQVKKVVQQRLLRVNSSKTSRHFLGTGAEHGVHWALSFLKYKRFCSKNEQLDMRGVMEAVMQGSLAFANRWEGQEAPPCPKCGALTTAAHVFWDCPQLVLDGRGEVRKAQELVNEVSEGHEVFWCRVLVPVGWVDDIFTGWDPPFFEMIVGQAGVLQLPPGAEAGTDGSGR